MKPLVAFGRSRSSADPIWFLGRGQLPLAIAAEGRPFLQKLARQLACMTRLLQALFPAFRSGRGRSVRPVALAAAVSLAVALPCVAAPGASTRHITGEPDLAYPIARRLQYALTVQNPSNRLVETATLHAYAPVRQTATQKCLALETSHTSELTVDELGNQVLHFAFDPLPPFSTRIVTIRATLALSEAPNTQEEASPDRFLSPEPLIEADHPEIRRLAQTLAGPTPAETVRNVFDWVASNIRYAGYLKDDRGALYALRTRQGDCTEYMSLFVALCRASGIPARGMAGYVTAESSILRPNEYHNWAEVWADGTWKLADPQRKVFAADQATYVAVALLSEHNESPVPRGRRFRLRGEGLTAHMGDGT